MNFRILWIILIYCVHLYPFQSIVKVKYTDGKGIGFDQGYSTLDYFGMENWKRVEALVNLRGHVFNSGDFAGNGGLGVRYKTSRCSLVGLYGFYDFREYHHLFLQQVSVGTEYLTQWADFRLNGYLPVGNNCAVEKKYFHSFLGNTIQIEKKFTGSLPMVEFEIGALLRPQMYFTAGPYYLFHNTTEGKLTKAGWGGKVHLDVNIGKYFSFGGGVTYDQVFDFGGTGFASVNIPFGGSHKKEKKRCSRLFRSMPIMRNEIIPVEKRSTIASLGSSGSDGDSSFFKIIFVRNTEQEGGDGTFEAPFASLQEAEDHSSPGDIIYVFPGDGTSHNMDMGIELQDGQILVSSGHEFTIDDVEIPALTPGVLPVITNLTPDEPVVKNIGEKQGLLSDFFAIFNAIVGP